MLPFRPETRDQAGLEDARLSETAAAVEHEQRMAAQAQMDLVDFRVPSKEIRARLFAEALQPEPRVLEVRQMDRRCRSGGALVHRVTVGNRPVVRRWRRRGAHSGGGGWPSAAQFSCCF